MKSIASRGKSSTVEKPFLSGGDFIHRFTLEILESWYILKINLVSQYFNESTQVKPRKNRGQSYVSPQYPQMAQWIWEHSQTF